MPNCWLSFRLLYYSSLINAQVMIVEHILAYTYTMKSLQERKLIKTCTFKKDTKQAIENLQAISNFGHKALLKVIFLYFEC